MNARVGCSLAAFAIRRSFVEMVGEPRVSPIVPSYGPPSRCRPLLGRVPRVGSPTSLLVLRHSDSSPPIPPRFVVLRSAVPPVCSVFVSPMGTSTTPIGLGFVRVARPALRGKRRGLPGSWMALVHVRRSQTPVEEESQDPGLLLPCVSAPFFRLPCDSPRRPPQQCGFRGSMSPPMHSLSTLRSCPRGQTHARLASGWWSSPLPVGTFTHGPCRKVSGATFHPPFPGLSWRKNQAASRQIL